MTETAPLHIRPYEPSDLEACRGLWRELTQRHRDIYEDPTIGGDDPGLSFDAHLASPNLAGVWVAEDETDIVALSGLLIDGEDGEVEPIVVRSASRSKGAGGQLLDHMIEEAKRRGVRFLSVRPVARNIEAISFFYEAGFRLLGHVDLFMELSRPTAREWRPGIALHGKDLRY